MANEVHAVPVGRNAGKGGGAGIRDIDLGDGAVLDPQ